VRSGHPVIFESVCTDGHATPLALLKFAITAKTDRGAGRAFDFRQTAFKASMLMAWPG
jgi:hypothetical protein